MITGILNVWQHDPADVAAAHARITADHPDRFLLGIGIGHPEATSDYTRPLKTMREFFDGLDAAATPVPKDERLAAALGPKMLDLAKERSLGTHPYFITLEHTHFARERLGEDALVAPEVAVVVDPNPESARRTAREYAKLYLGLTNYTSNLLKFGFTEADIADGGSDRLIDAVIPHGSPSGSPRTSRPTSRRAPTTSACSRSARTSRRATTPRWRPCSCAGARPPRPRLAHAEAAERAAHQRRAVGGRGHLLEPEAEQQRVLGRGAGEEVHGRSGRSPSAPAFGGLPGGRAADGPRARGALEAVRCVGSPPITTRVSSTNAPTPPVPGSVT